METERARSISMETKRARSGKGKSRSLKSCSLKSCSSFKFGSFVLLAAVDNCFFKREESLVMLSPVSAVSESDESPWPWYKRDSRAVVVDHVGLSKDKLILLGGEEGWSDNQVLKLHSFGVPVPDYEFRTIVGSCNGLVCLYGEDANTLSLWNPNTQEHRFLPKPRNFGEDWNQEFALFGFDAETKDYKVVLLTGFRSMHYRPVSPVECLCRVQVYSLSTDSWRLLEGIIALPGDVFLFKYDSLYLNGTSFFLAMFFHTKLQPCLPESDRFVISFDFTKEIFTPMQLPDHHRQQVLYLRSLGDKIALFTRSESSHNALTCEDFTIWLLKDGISSNSIVTKESWTKLHFFQIKHEIPGSSNLPIGLSDDGEFALLKTCGSTAYEKKMKVYHLVSKKVKHNFLSCSLILSKAHPFKPSLVSIIGGNGGGGNGDSS